MKSSWVFLVFASAVLFSTPADCARILGISPMPSYSHFALTFRIFKELADRGHDVTVISAHPQKEPIKNYRDVPVVEMLTVFDDMKGQFFQMTQAHPLMMTVFTPNFGLKISEMIFKNENVQKLLTSGEKFDMVILESFLSDALMGLAPHFNAHLVMLSPQPAGSWFNHYVANPGFPAYVPNLMSGYSSDMNFPERIMNFIYDSIIHLKREFDFMPTQAALMKKYLPNVPCLSEVRYNTSVYLLNGHESVTVATPRVPNMVQIGGYHIKPTKQLPADLKKLVDNAKDGVILFSLGSNARSADMPPEIISEILKGLSKIKQTVLWKFEEDLKDVPSNVKISKWLPQQDILAHPNCVAFISHGGLLSTIETVYFGIPIIGMPIFGDQKTNVNTAVKNGYALTVPIAEVTERKLIAAVNEITNNKKYSEEVKRRSKLMHDREVKPLDTAIYWIEYVLRHNGAAHLKSPALKLTWYQRELLDVYLFIGSILLATVYLIKLVITKLCCRKKKTVPSSKKKN